MKMLTAKEHWALQRLLLPHGTRSVDPDSPEDVLRQDLVEQGRATFTAYPEWHESAGGYDLTETGRLALRVWPAIEASLGSRR